MGDIKIIELTNADDQFYKIMGRFLSRRDIVKEQGASIWDDDGKIWFVAVSGKTVLGFVAAMERASKIDFCSDHVLPEYRGSGVYDLLFATRLKKFIGCTKPLCATVNDSSAPAYMRHGFIATVKRGSWSILTYKGEAIDGVS